MKVTRTEWFLPAFSVTLGLVMLTAQWSAGNRDSGLGSLGIMVAFGALVLFGGPSETIRGLRSDGRDERFRELDIHATAFAGLAVITRSSSPSSSSSPATAIRRHTPGSERSVESPISLRSWRCGFGAEDLAVLREQRLDTERVRVSVAGAPRAARTAPASCRRASG